MAKTFYDSDFQILFVGTDKKITLEDMFSQLEELKNNEDLPRDLKILEDSRLSSVDFNENDLPKLAKSLTEVLGKYKSFRHAVLLDNPIQTAYAIMMSNLVKNPKYNLKVFSTVEAAKEWLTIL
jgi:hypothetical protein